MKNSIPSSFPKSAKMLVVEGEDAPYTLSITVRRSEHESQKILFDKTRVRELIETLSIYIDEKIPELKPQQTEPTNSLSAFS